MVGGFRKASVMLTFGHINKGANHEGTQRKSIPERYAKALGWERALTMMGACEDSTEARYVASVEGERR